MTEIAARTPEQNLPTLDPMIQSYVPRELALVKLGEPPQTIAEAIYWARTLAMSNLLPDSLRDRRTQQIKVADVVLLIAYGAELGLSPLQAINAIYIVKGRPMISALLWAQRIRMFGHQFTVTVEKNEDGMPLAATATIIRGDDKTEHVVSFSLQDAQRAGLCSVRDGKIYARSQDGKPQPWELYTERMLVCRASAHCGRLGAADAVLGNFGIQGEEFNELEPDDGFDAFVAGRAITGPTPVATTPLEDQAAELEALAARFEQERAERDGKDKMALGAILKGVKERVEQPGTAVPRTGDQAAAWEEYVEASNALADEAEAAGIDLNDHEQNPLIKHVCEICGARMVKAEHIGPAFDHAPLWLKEPDTND